MAKTKTDPPEEIAWFEECERQEKFISKEEFLKNYNYSIY